MDANKTNQLLLLIGDKVPVEQIESFKTIIESMDDDKFFNVQMIVTQLKNPMISLLLTFFLFGGRAYIGQYAQTIIYWAITFVIGWLIVPLIGLFVWWVIDLIKIGDETRLVNAQNLSMQLNMIKG